MKEFEVTVSYTEYVNAETKEDAEELIAKSIDNDKLTSFDFTFDSYELDEHGDILDDE